MTEYFLVLRIITPEGEKVLGKFFLGDSKDAAYAIYGQLRGTEIIDGKHLLFFDFIESTDSLPVDLRLLGCNLGEAGENIKIIVKNLFTSYL